MPTEFTDKILTGFNIGFHVDVKYHTIRAGNRFKKGDYFSPRIWTDKPYASKQYQFHPDILIVLWLCVRWGFPVLKPIKEYKF